MSLAVFLDTGPLSILTVAALTCAGARKGPLAIFRLCQRTLRRLSGKLFRRAIASLPALSLPGDSSIAEVAYRLPYRSDQPDRGDRPAHEDILFRPKAGNGAAKSKHHGKGSRNAGAARDAAPEYIPLLTQATLPGSFARCRIRHCLSDGSPSAPGEPLTTPTELGKSKHYKRCIIRASGKPTASGRYARRRAGTRPRCGRSTQSVSSPRRSARRALSWAGPSVRSRL